MRRRHRRVKSYIAVVADSEGVTYRYLTHGSRRQDVENEARMSARRSGTTFVAIEEAFDSRSTTRRRHLVVAGITVALAGILLTGLVLVGDTVSSAL